LVIAKILIIAWMALLPTWIVDELAITGASFAHNCSMKEEMVKEERMGRIINSNFARW
jgi:hypothetical protein